MSRRFPYVSTTLLAVALGASVWIAARALAQDAVPSTEEVRHVARSIQADRDATEDRIATLESLLETLGDSDENAVQIAAVESLIASEKRAQRQREQRLQDVVLVRHEDAEFSEFGAILEAELSNLAAAIDGLNQSYTIAPVKGCTSSSGGSRFNDPDEQPEEIRLDDDAQEQRRRLLQRRVEQLQRELEKMDEPAV